MHGIGTSFFRLPRVAAWLAGAAFLAGSMATPAFAQSEETAFAVPRLGGDAAPLPRPIAAPDAAALRRLFADPSSSAANFARLTAAVDAAVPLNRDMLGHVLALRYLGDRRSQTADLASWLAQYAALPDAPVIAAALRRRDPAAILPDGITPEDAPDAAPGLGSEEIVPDGPGLHRNALLDTTMRQMLHDARFDAALHLIGRTRGLSTLYGAALKAEVAQALFTHNRDAAALSLARTAMAGEGARVGLAGYVGGLAAWRLGHTADAAWYFAAAARAPIASAALRAGGAFWAARSLADPDAARQWLALAAVQPRTFYGQLARRLLGSFNGLAFSGQVLGEADVAAVAAEPGGLRAFALLQLGQPDRAATELRLLAGIVQDRPALARAVMLVAEQAGLHDLAGDLSAGVVTHGGADATPLPRLRPRHGFQIDPALVYGLARVESNFDANAVSAMGAEGLMQIMPATAGWMRPAGAATARLHDPAVNLELGQRYVASLAGHDVVGGDLIRLLASYNSGPAAFGRWADAIQAHGDPLLFIEAIPTSETRSFVQRTLSYTWIYATRLRLPAPSLDALVAGQFPAAPAAAIPETLHKAPTLH